MQFFLAILKKMFIETFESGPIKWVCCTYKSSKNSIPRNKGLGRACPFSAKGKEY